LQQHTAFSVAHYLTSSHVLSSVFEPGLAAGLGPWWVVILAAAVLGPILCLLRGSSRHTRMLGLVALASLAAYVVTPESAAGPAGNPLGFAFNLRYAAPALALSLAILPLAPALGGARRQAVMLAALLVVIAATLAQARLWPSGHLAGALLIGAAVLASAVLGASRVRRPPRRPLLASLAGLIAVVAVGGYVLQRHYLRGRYAFQPGVSYLARAWAFFRHVHHARVGIVGTFGGFFSYPLAGLDDSNSVWYIARRGSRGSFTTLATCPQWRAAVNASQVRYVVSTPSRDPWHPKQLGSSPEGAWTATDPAAHVVYRRRAAGQTITVFELDRPLSPAGCH
jgi:hypothetical protein